MVVAKTLGSRRRRAASRSVVAGLWGFAGSIVATPLATAASPPVSSAAVPAVCNATTAASATVGMAYSSSSGYWLAQSSGSVLSCGHAVWYGQASTAQMHGTASGIATAPSGHGYYVVSRSGGVFNFGVASWHGSPYAASHGPLGSPAVGIATTATGYYVVTAAGNVFNYGGAAWRGSPSAARLHLASPAVGIATSPSGGYWLGASDGGVFSYSAPFYGSAVNAVSCSGASFWKSGIDGTNSAAMVCPGSAAVGSTVSITAWSCGGTLAPQPGYGTYSFFFMGSGQETGTAQGGNSVRGGSFSATTGTMRVSYTIPARYNLASNSGTTPTAPRTGYHFDTLPPDCSVPFTVTAG